MKDSVLSMNGDFEQFVSMNAELDYPMRIYFTDAVGI